MKEQGKNPQDQKNEEEIGNLPEKEFRVMIVKMIQDLRIAPGSINVSYFLSYCYKGTNARFFIKKNEI